jgi:NAD(P)-dependent dehydrogenase (short-subunit alcohol dehydrogenase family)
MITAKNKVVAITGGTRGIGRAVAEAFLEAGDAVAVLARSAPDKPLSQKILQVRGDIRRRDDLKRFVSEVSEKFGHLDVFVNCAGISRWRTLEQIDEEFLRDMLETNVMGTLWGCAAAAAALRPGGAIVNVSSLAGKRGSANNSAYCASKFAVNGITQALAKELGPRQIRVNAVCPVYVETDYILQSLSEPASPAGGKPVKSYLAGFASTQTALGRLPKAEEVASAVLFLAGPSASAITGQCLNIDCGTLPQ